MTTTHASHRSHRIRVGVLLTAVTTAASAQALAACSTSSTASAPAGTAIQNPAHTAAATSASAEPPTAQDPCALLSDADAGTALGGPAQHKAIAPKDASSGGVTVTELRCSFDLVTSDQTGHGIVIAVYVGAGRKYFDGTTANTLPALTGLGDAATGNANEVDVFSKSTMLKIYGSLSADDGMQQIARLAIAKL